MKVESYRKSKTGNDETIGIFAMGEKEVEVLHSLLCNALKFTPMVLETQTTINRMRTIKKCFNKVISNWGDKK